MNTLKNEIKKLATEQVELKNQKKTVNLIGERITDSTTAAYHHSWNRNELRQMYMALGLLKGRDMTDIESNSKTIININAVNVLIKKYEHEYNREGSERCDTSSETGGTNVLLQSGGNKSGE